MGPGEGSRRAGLSSDHGVAPGDGTYAHWVARIGHVPYFVGRIGIGAKHIDLVVVDRQCTAIAHADHLGPAVDSVRHREVEKVFRVPRITHIDNRRAVLFIVTGERI